MLSRLGIAVGVVGGVIAFAGCSIASPVTTPMMSGGMHRAATTQCSVPDASGAVVQVRLGDMPGSMMWSSYGWQHMMLRVSTRSVAAGAVTFVAYNMGTRAHELVVLPLPDGRRAGQRTVGSDGKVDETGSLGEASTTCGAGPGEGIAAGSTSWVTLVLTPGRYELVCNLKNHYASGMYAELDVTG